MEKTVEFLYNRRPCTVIEPEHPAEGRPWVWRAEFLYAFDSLDRALLAKGWHIAYCNLQDQYGCPAAVARMKQFHDFVVKQFALAPRAVILGFSRGGLYACNYAILHPEDISVLYLDAPVLDVTSWPGGFGASERCEREWEECKAVYGFSEEDAKSFCGSPVHRLDALLNTGVPVLLVAGGADTAVPYPENGQLLERALKNAPNPPAYQVVVKPGCGHHPHSLENPAELVEFVLANVR